MAKLFITGSADGLGQLAAKALVGQGHEVVLHGRNNERSEDALKEVPDAAGVVTGDLSSLEETISLAEEVNKLGTFDVVIHNAGVYRSSGELIVKVNTLAPYILTALINPPGRLIYMSSGMHRSGQPKLHHLEQHADRITYSDSKLHDIMLAKAVARLWPDVYANAVDPGWVPTKMGGPGATGDLVKGYETQVWLAVSNDPEAQVSGRYFYHQQQRKSLPIADDTDTQEELLAVCERITGIAFPKGQ